MEIQHPIWKSVNSLDEFVNNKEIKFDYVAKIQNDEDEIGYMLFDFTENHGNHIVFTFVDTKKKLYVLDYFPGIRMDSFRNYGAHKLVHFINDQIPECNIYIKQNREIFLHYSYDITERGVTEEEIRKLYKCSFLTCDCFHELLEEALVRSIPEKDYCKEAIKSHLFYMFEKEKERSREQQNEDEDEFDVDNYNDLDTSDNDEDDDEEIELDLEDIL